MRVGDKTEQFQFTLRLDIPEEKAVIDELNKLPKGRRGQKIAGLIMAAMINEVSVSVQPAETSRPRSSPSAASFDDDKAW